MYIEDVWALGESGCKAATLFLLGWGLDISVYRVYILIYTVDVHGSAHRSVHSIYSC